MAPGETPVEDTNADPSGQQGFKPRRLPLAVIKSALLQCLVWEIEDQAGDGLRVGFTWVGLIIKVDQFISSPIETIVLLNVFISMPSC